MTTMNSARRWKGKGPASSATFGPDRNNEYEFKASLVVDNEQSLSSLTFEPPSQASQHRSSSQKVNNSSSGLKSMRGRRVIESSSSDESDDIITPAKRRKKYLAAANEQEDDEGEEEDGGGSSSGLESDNIVQERTRGRRNESMQNRKQKLAQLLNRSDPVVNLDSSAEEDQVQEGDDGVVVIEEEEDDDSFVVSDDDVAELPLEFSMKRHQPFEYSFKVLVQGMIHQVLKDDPGIWNDEYFKAPRNAVSRRIESVKNSLVASSAWKPWFTRALEERPNVTWSRRDHYEDIVYPVCDACYNNQNNAAYVVTFTGAKYNKVTLKPSEEEEGEEGHHGGGNMVIWNKEEKMWIDLDAETDNGRNKKRKREILENKDNVVVSLDKDWNLGKSCLSRASITHSLHHWFYHLTQRLKKELREGGYDIEVWDEEDVDQVVDDMEGKRVSDKLLKFFEARIEKAQEYLLNPSKLVEAYL